MITPKCYSNTQHTKPNSRKDPTIIKSFLNHFIFTTYENQCRIRQVNKESICIHSKEVQINNDFMGKIHIALSKTNTIEPTHPILHITENNLNLRQNHTKTTYSVRLPEKTTIIPSTITTVKTNAHIAKTEHII